MAELRSMARLCHDVSFVQAYHMQKAIITILVASLLTEPIDYLLPRPSTLTYPFLLFTLGYSLPRPHL